MIQAQSEVPNLDGVYSPFMSDMLKTYPRLAEIKGT